MRSLSYPRHADGTAVAAQLEVNSVAAIRRDTRQHPNLSATAMHGIA